MNTYLKYRPVWLRIFTLGGLIFGVSIVLGLMSYYIASRISGFSIQEVINPDFNNIKMVKVQKWLVPITAGIGTFLIPSLIYSYFADPQPKRFLRMDFKPAAGYWLSAITIMIIAMPSAFWLGELNRHLDLSNLFPAFDKWMKSTEAINDKAIKSIIGKQDTVDLLVNLVVLGFVPAFCEEIFFRALIMKGIIRTSKNVWLGIILSAVIFSAFHLQFLTFLTRLEMGIILGALFWYSGSLWVAVTGHFIFNAVQVIAVYWNSGVSDSPQGLLSSGMVAASFIMTGLLIYLIKKSSTITVAEVFDDDEDDDFHIGPRDQYIA